MKNLNRRKWIKSSLLGMGGLSLLTKGFADSMETAALSKISSQSRLVELNPGHFNKVPMRARLLANENPFGPSEKAQKAIAAAVAEGNRYGHGDAAYLIDLIAEKEGVSKDCIMLGPGSTDLLEKTAIALCRKGGQVISADPSYMSLVNTAQAVGATWQAVPLLEDHSHDLQGMKAAITSDTRLIYVCNPNNPMGSVTDAVALRSFCKSASQKSPVFVDEAYLEFMDNPMEQSMVDLVAKGHDVIVARTFSKIHGMAGLRIGYMVATPERVASVTQLVRSTMGLCVTSLKGAIASYQDEAFVANCREWNRTSRAYTSEQLHALGFQEIPSHTSFMIFPIQTAGKAFAQTMMDQGVGIRVYEIDDQDWCRVSMGTLKEMQYFIEALKTTQA
ncbi:pyridoxal phosphate-dependent aminotransferase [Pararhodonellum marinum]|uniref:pyridoxal phosphate-dependent aminotransferase n=1 Tax=Pararhodonellum marinum TaxID=2755358 RepID=UPI00188FE852|nr:histidinol-phosphate transaminase [Pararhodonellum marinum]